MDANPFLGVFLHAVGGLAAASFYLPYKGVRAWSWESYWLVGGFFSWIIAPWAVALLTAPAVLSILAEAPPGSLLWSYLFGLLWGVGGLTFGLSVRYLGMSLGYALALGFCAAFGTLIPPIFQGNLGELIGTPSGVTTLAGVAVCLAGIAVCGRAGVAKERELSDEQKRKTIGEFSFVKGALVATFAGVMSACMAFAIAAGKPIAALAVAHGTPDLWKNTPVFVVILAGGFTTNFLWCVLLNVRNRSGGDYLSLRTPLVLNYVLSAAAGTTWYLQFMFYGMGTTKMGKYDFSSWTIHMAFIIVFSNLWGLVLMEWRGSGARTLRLIAAGIAVLVASTVVVGYGNYLVPPAPADLAADWLPDPSEDGSLQPRFRWTFTPARRLGPEVSCQVLVASEPDLLEPDTADLWDSGRVDLGRGEGIRYEGAPLAPGTTCWWKVRVWDAQGDRSGWSDPAEATMPTENGPAEVGQAYTPAWAPAIVAMEKSRKPNRSALVSLPEQTARTSRKIASPTSSTVWRPSMIVPACTSMISPSRALVPGLPVILTTGATG